MVPTLFFMAIAWELGWGGGSATLMYPTSLWLWSHHFRVWEMSMVMASGCLGWADGLSVTREEQETFEGWERGGQGERWGELGCFLWAESDRGFVCVRYAWCVGIFGFLFAEDVDFQDPSYHDYTRVARGVLSFLVSMCMQEALISFWMPLLFLLCTLIIQHWGPLFMKDGFVARDWFGREWVGAFIR